MVGREGAAAFFSQPDDKSPEQSAGDAAYRNRLLELAAYSGDPILFGATALGVEDGEVGFYNRAYLVSGQGKAEGWYDKIQLVPFGEYVPLSSAFGFCVNPVVQVFADMFPGPGQTIVTVDGPNP